jgi:DedD protein
VPAPERSQRPSPAPAQPERARPGAAAAAKPPAAASAKPADVPATPGTFTVQVGAFRERKVADSVAARLKSKGFPAYVISPEGAAGVLFNVRVGAYPARPDAERAQERLRDQEKFKPFIVKN